MSLSVTEFEELNHLRENVRRRVALLELCWSCQRVSECEQALVDDGPKVWLCPECAAKSRLQNSGSASLRVWPETFATRE